MKPLSIIIGSSAPADQEIIDKYDFVSVPFKVIWPEGEALPGENIFEKMRNAAQAKITNGPKTSQPSIGIYKKAFEDALMISDRVLYISLSSKLSGAYNSAIQAQKMMAPENQSRVSIFDSLNADGSETIFAIKARELSERGLSVEEIINVLEKLRDEIKLFATLETSAWLEAGGRINHTLSIMIDQMQKRGMRPILMIKKGEIKPAMLQMQAKDSSTAILKTLDGLAKEILKKGKTCRIILTHGDNQKEIEVIKNEVEKKYQDKIRIEFIGLSSQVIGAHIGPGTVICCLSED